MNISTHTTTFTTIPSNKSTLPGRLVAGDTNPGQLVAWDKLKGKARQGFFPERHGGTHLISVKLISATVDNFLGRHVARESEGGGGEMRTSVAYPSNTLPTPGSFGDFERLGLGSGIIPKRDLGIPICQGNVLGTSLPDALHVVHPGLGVYNPMHCLEGSLVGIVQLLQVLLDARIDICPALGLYMRHQVKQDLQSYTTKQRQS
ncbi:hypothetical protein Tco_0227774 [Tanacetum coccineum]